MSPPEQSSEKARPVVCKHANACLAELQSSGEAPCPEAAIRAAGGWTVFVLAFATPSGDETPGLTECDRDCLALLAQVREPLSGVRARKELEKRGLGIYGLVTVKRSLVKLKRMHLVGNSKRRPRGYFLPENLPLFRHLYQS